MPSRGKQPERKNPERKKQKKPRTNKEIIKQKIANQTKSALSKISVIQKPHQQLLKAQELCSRFPLAEENIKKQTIQLLSKKIPPKILTLLENLPFSESHSLRLKLSSLSIQRKTFHSLEQLKESLISANFSPTTINIYFEIYINQINPLIEKQYLLEQQKTQTPFNQKPPEKRIQPPSSRKRYQITSNTALGFLKSCNVPINQLPIKEKGQSYSFKELLQIVEKDTQEKEEKSTRKRSTDRQSELFSKEFIEASSKLLSWWRASNREIIKLYEFLEEENLEKLVEIMQSGQFGFYMPKYQPRYPKKP